MIRKSLLGLSATALVAILAVALTVDRPSPESVASGGGGVEDVESSGGPQEAVQVHGHWVIEVRDLDGTLAGRREFENDLVPEGQYLLASILIRSQVPLGWMVFLGNTGQPCINAAGSPTQCNLAEDGVSYPGFDPGAPNFFATLTLDYETDTRAAVLSATATVQRDCSVQKVQASLFVQDVESGRGSIRTFSYSSFTPIAVQTGQSIQLSVRYTFAPAS